MSLIKKGLFILFYLLHMVTYAQPDSSHLRISLLTCTPGAELYSTFGHTAIRVTDSAANSDIVYNYGTFDFNDPGFYLKFVQGKLLYRLSAEYFGDFINFYQQEQRGITEQVLNLSSAEKQRLQQALEKNLRPENCRYKYDFFFDNCTTRARDMIVTYKSDSVEFKPAMPPGTRFRQGIHAYLEKNNDYWSKLGIDILLGAPTDAIMTNSTMQFLPDNLMVSFDSCVTKNALVQGKQPLYTFTGNGNISTFFTPMVVFWLLLAAVILLSLVPARPARLLLYTFDMLYFFAAGLLGVILIFMWAGTDHAMCRNNYNLLWAWPIHMLLCFFMFSKKNWVKKYYGFTAAAMGLVLVSWFFLPQQMNNALIPLVLLLIYRSAAVYNRLNK